MFEKEITFDRFIRWALIALLIVSVLFALNYLGTVLLPFFVAWLIAYLLYPIVKFVQYRLHVPTRALSIIVTLIFVTAIVAGVVWLIIPPMIEQFSKLGNLMTAYIHKTAHITSIPFRFIGQGATIIISIIGSMITLLYMFFILLDYEYLTENWIRIFPKKVRPFWQELMKDVEKALNNYIRGQGLVALSMGILFCIGFTIIDFPMAIGLGILIGIMDMVPYLHTFALIPTVFLALLKSIDTGQNFWIILISAVAVFIIVQVIIDMIITPKIMGKAMGLNPAILLLSLSVWGALLGFIGLIVALPLTTLVIAYYKRYVTKEEDEPDPPKATKDKKPAVQKAPETLIEEQNPQNPE